MTGPLSQTGEDLGGCDNRYRAAPCVWGSAPDPLVTELAGLVPVVNAVALDVGCGEGRHADFLARHGASVRATDVSALAVARARRTVGDAGGRIAWDCADLRTMELPPSSVDGVLAISVLHWLLSRDEAAAVLGRLHAATRPGGWHVVSAFNDRQPYQRTTIDTRDPVLLPHSWLLARYDGWRLARVADLDMTHAHPGHEETHTHAVTEFIAIQG